VYKHKSIFLKLVAKSTGRKRKQILNTCSNDSIKALSEIAHNTLKGILKVNPTNLKKLKKHRNKVRQLAKKRLALKQKRQLIVQQGGFLPFLVAPFLSAVGSFAGKALADSFGI